MRTALVISVFAFLLSAAPAGRQEDTRLVEAIAEHDAALVKVARLELQLIERDQQIAKVQYTDGKAAIEWQRKLLEADAIAAECQLTTRASSAIEQLRILERPAAGAVYDLTTGRWLRPDQEK